MDRERISPEDALQIQRLKEEGDVGALLMQIVNGRAVVREAATQAISQLERGESENAR